MCHISPVLIKQKPQPQKDFYNTARYIDSFLKWEIIWNKRVVKIRINKMVKSGKNKEDNETVKTEFSDHVSFHFV